VLSLVHWLLQCYHHAATNLPETTNDMLQKPAAILNNMLNCNFLTAMLYLAKHDDKGNGYYYIIWIFFLFK
jgi:hypothetical protein